MLRLLKSFCVMTALFVSFSLIGCAGDLPTAFIAELSSEISLSDTIVLDGSASAAGSDLETESMIYIWKIELKPVGSQFEIPEGYNAPTLEFKPDVHGKYVFSLTVQVGDRQSKPESMVFRTDGYAFQTFSLLKSDQNFPTTRAGSPDEGVDELFITPLNTEDFTDLIPRFTLSHPASVVIIPDPLNPAAGSPVVSGSTLLDLSDPVCIGIIDPNNTIRYVVKLQAQYLPDGSTGSVGSGENRITAFKIIKQSPGNEVITETVSASIYSESIEALLPMGTDFSRLDVEIVYSGGSAALSDGTRIGTTFTGLNTVCDPEIIVTAANGGTRRYKLKFREDIPGSMKPIPGYDPLTANGGAQLELGTSKPAGPVPASIAPFNLSQTEVSYELWKSVIDQSSGYSFRFRGQEGPAGQEGAGSSRNGTEVTGISYADAVVWCNALSEFYGLTPVYTINSFRQTPIKSSVFNHSDVNQIPDIFRGGQHRAICVRWDADGFRLPTVTEWEYISRLESSSPVSGGAQSFLSAGAEITDSTAERANEAGIFGMGSGLFEYCWDNDPLAGGADAYPQAAYATDNPIGIEISAAGTPEIAVAGFSSPAGDPVYAGASGLSREVPWRKRTDTGFRVVQGSFNKLFSVEKRVVSIGVSGNGLNRTHSVSGTNINFENLPFGILHTPEISIRFAGKWCGLYMDSGSGFQTVAQTSSSDLLQHTFTAGELINYSDLTAKNIQIQVESQTGERAVYSLTFKEILSDFFYVDDASGSSDSNPGTAEHPLATIDEAVGRLPVYLGGGHKVNTIRLASGIYTTTTGYDLSPSGINVNWPFAIEGGYDSTFTPSGRQTGPAARKGADASVIHHRIESAGLGTISDPVTLLKWGSSGSSDRLSLSGVKLTADDSAAHYALINARSSISLNDCELYSGAITNAAGVLMSGGTSRITHSLIAVKACNAGITAAVSGSENNPPLLTIWSSILIGGGSTAGESCGIKGSFADGSRFYNNTIDSGIGKNSIGMKLQPQLGASPTVSPRLFVRNNLIFFGTGGTNRGIDISGGINVLMQNNSFDLPLSGSAHYAIAFKDRNEIYKGFKDSSPTLGLTTINSLVLPSSSHYGNWDFQVRGAHDSGIDAKIPTQQSPWNVRCGGEDLTTVAEAPLESLYEVSDYAHTPRTAGPSDPVGGGWSLGAVETDYTSYLKGKVILEGASPFNVTGEASPEGLSGLTAILGAPVRVSLELAPGEQVTSLQQQAGTEGKILIHEISNGEYLLFILESITPEPVIKFTKQVVVP